MKKINFVMIGLVLLILFISGCSSATSGGSSTAPIDLFKNVITLKFLSDWGITSTTIDPIEGFTRFLILIVLFAILFKGAELLKLGNNVAIVIALVFSLLTTIFIPGTILLAAATSYGTIFSLVLLGLPIGLGFAGYFFLKEYPWIRFGLMGLLWFLLLEMSKHIGDFRTGSGPHYATIITMVVSWIDLVTGAVLLFFIISGVQAFISLASGHTGSDVDLKSSAQWVHNKLTSKSRRQKTSQINQYIEDEKELELLGNVRVQKELVLKIINTIEGAGQIVDSAENTKLVKGVEAVEKKLETAKKEFRTVLRNTLRQVRASDKAITQHSKNKQELQNKDKDIENLKTLENLILKKHKEARDALDKALVEAAVAIKEAQKLKRITVVPALFAHFVPPSTTETVQQIVGLIKSRVVAVDVEYAVTAQKEAIQAFQGIVTETHDRLKWTD